MNTPRAALLLCLVGTAVHPTAAQTCVSGWSDRFTTAVLSAAPGSGGPSVGAQIVYDDGSGPALIITGSFVRAGASTVNGIARWDGTTLTPLGSGLSQSPYGPLLAGLAVFDPDGPGPLPPLLIAGGQFDHAGGAPVHNLAAWDGNHWTEIPGTPVVSDPPNSGYVSFVKVVDPDGTGPLAPRLYIVLSHPGPLYYALSVLWAWDGAAWTQVATQTDAVGSLEFFTPDMGSPTFYATDYPAIQTHCIFQSSSGLLRLTQPTWQSVLDGGCQSYDCGQHFTCGGVFPDQVVAFDTDGSGPSPSLLILRGRFDAIGTVPAHNLAAYDGVSWSEFAGGTDGISGMFSLTDPTTQRPSIYFESASVGGVGAPALIRYDSTGLTPIPFGLQGGLSSMVPFTPPGSLPSIYVGGPTIAGAPVPGWGRLTPVGWAPIGQCLNNEVHALSVYTPPGGSPTLYAGGAFTAAAGQLAVSLARWNGARWSPAANLNNHVDCMVPFGPYLALGGKFTLGGLATGGVGLFDGQSVLPLGSGMNTPVHALGVLNSQLYAGGEFTAADGVPAIGISRWNGNAWTAVGSGVNNHVDAIATFDDGTGPALYIGGKFTVAGGLAAAHIARWNGSAWSAVPGGGTDGDVEALTVLNGGSGPALYVGGAFTHAGGIAANRIARFRGGAWSALGAGADGTVRALSALDPDGPGFASPVLVVGGDFLAAGGLPAAYAAIWNGSAWEQMATGLDNHVLALASFDPSGTDAPSIYVGGAFYNSGGIPSPFIAQWTRSAPCYANCDNSTTPPLLNVNDFMCFLNRFAAGDSYANCDGSTTPPVLNVNDFTCFLDRAAAGCP